MLTTRFGIEIEFTGITRETAAKITAEHFHTTFTNDYDYYDTKRITAEDGRVWKVMSDGSIKCQRKQGQQKAAADREYSVEIVSPILTYKEDIDSLQELIRKLRKAGAFTNSSCGIHIHLDGKDHTPGSIRNFIKVSALLSGAIYSLTSGLFLTAVTDSIIGVIVGFIVDVPFMCIIKFQAFNAILIAI